MDIKITLEELAEIQEKVKANTMQVLGITREELEQAIEENRKRWQEIASKINKQRLEDLRAENEQLKERIETIRRQSAAQDTKQVLKSCDITLML